MSSNSLWNVERGGYLADLPDILTVSEVAAGLGRTSRTIRNLIASGKLPGIYFPGETRLGVMREDVIEFATIRHVPVTIRTDVA